VQIVGIGFQQFSPGFSVSKQLIDLILGQSSLSYIDIAENGSR
jgi:hypothetical protein